MGKRNINGTALTAGHMHNNTNGQDKKETKTNQIHTKEEKSKWERYSVYDEMANDLDWHGHPGTNTNTHKKSY